MFVRRRACRRGRPGRRAAFVPHTPDEILQLMRRTIIECLDAGAMVTRRHLLRANVPVVAIDLYFSSMLRQVIAERVAKVIKP